MTITLRNDFHDTAIEQGVCEFVVRGQRYRYCDRGHGVWARDDWDRDNFGGGCWVHMSTIAALSDATPRQLHDAGNW